MDNLFLIGERVVVRFCGFDFIANIEKMNQQEAEVKLMLNAIKGSHGKYIPQRDLHNPFYSDVARVGVKKLIKITQ